MKKTIVICVAILIVGVIAAFVSVLSYLSRDEPPPDDADLRLPRLEIPDEENAFTYFQLACDALTYSDADEEKIDSMREGDEWDAAFVEELLSKNNETFDFLAKGMACAEIEVPEIMGPDTELPYLSTWRRIARLCKVRVLHLRKSDKEKEAFEEALGIVEFGRMIERCRGAPIHYHVGRDIKEIGLCALREMLADTKLDEESLRSHVGALAGSWADQNAFADSFRAGYVAMARALDSIAAGKKYPGLELPDLPKWISIKPNKTKRMFAEALRLIIEGAGKTFKEYAQEVSPRLPKYPASRADTRVEVLLSGNTVGLMLYEALLPVFSGITKTKCRENVSVAATRLLIALKCYKMKTGELPGTLDALVPDYIDKIPSDDFDGEPMRYSAEKKIIYSVGEDLNDDGGGEEKDIIFEIKF